MLGVWPGGHGVGADDFVDRDCHQAGEAVRTPPAQLAPAARQVSVCPSRKVQVTGCQSPGSSGPSQARVRAASAGGVRTGAAGPGPVARFEGHHERQPGLGQRPAEPALVPVGAVRGDRPERESRRTARGWPVPVSLTQRPGCRGAVDRRIPLAATVDGGLMFLAASRNAPG